ncbi:MAG: hypothetical protein NT167_15670 [Verrucomicrobia bacterium]|nr:hypothetical protein [Verrucomicrobiota bacterium]
MTKNVVWVLIASAIAVGDRVALEQYSSILFEHGNIRVFRRQ